MSGERLKFVVLEPGMYADNVPEDISRHADIVYGPSDRRLSEAELVELARGKDALFFTSRDDINARVLEQLAPHLKMAVKCGAYPENVDFEAASRLGIAVAWTPGANVRSVAEYTIMLTLLGLRRFGEVLEVWKAGGWRNTTPVGTELAGRTVGVVGLGAIGREVARMFTAMGASVVAYDPFQDEEVFASVGATSASLEDVFARADVLSLHCAMTPETARMVNADTLRLMKPHALIVNTARGGLIDEDALLADLEANPLRVAALDVFAEEPLPADHPLRRTDRVIATPHVAARTTQATANERLWALRGAIAFLRGETPEKIQVALPKG